MPWWAGSCGSARGRGSLPLQLRSDKGGAHVAHVCPCCPWRCLGPPRCLPMLPMALPRAIGFSSSGGRLGQYENDDDDDADDGDDDDDDDPSANNLESVAILARGGGATRPSPAPSCWIDDDPPSRLVVGEYACERLRHVRKCGVRIRGRAPRRPQVSQRDGLGARGRPRSRCHPIAVVAVERRSWRSQLARGFAARCSSHARVVARCCSSHARVVARCCRWRRWRSPHAR